MNAARSPIADRRFRRGPVVSDRGNPNPSVTASIPRDVRDALDRHCAKTGVSKAKYLARLIIEDMRRLRLL